MDQQRDDDDIRPSPREHWSRIWRKSDPRCVSWYEDSPEVSLALIESYGISPAHSVIDVGAGQSSLTQHLLRAGYEDLGVLDIAEPAIEALRHRIHDGDGDGNVTFFVDDVRSFRSGRTWDVWHDRAVFHFLTNAADRARYVNTLRANLAPGGRVIMATFAPEGPERCSGLPASRYSGDDLARALGDWLELREERLVQHSKPAGGEQLFCYAVLERADGD